MPGVITNSESPTAADHDRITATRETLEDYTLRLAPRSYRRWPPAVVGISALGGIAYLADFAIGANVGITWGTANALCGIAIFALVVFVTGLPLAYYAARYNIDLDLPAVAVSATTARWSPTSSLPRSRSSSLPWRARSWLRALS